MTTPPPTDTDDATNIFGHDAGGDVSAGAARFVGRIITTAEELDTLDPDTGLLNERTGAPWAMHTQFDTEASRAYHREALIRQLPLKITSHPADGLIEMRRGDLADHDTALAERIAQAIEAAPQCRCTDSYCTSRAAYANAANIARSTPTQGATP